MPISCCGVTHEYPAGVISEGPNVARKLLNLSRDTIKHVANGARTVSDEIKMWRLDQCFACTQYYDKQNETCTHRSCGCGMRKKRGIFDAAGWASKQCPIGRWSNPPVNYRFVTCADLARDTLVLASKLPSAICAVAGIPRSGMIPASLLATHLHVPLLSLDSQGLHALGSGLRLRGDNDLNRPGPIVVVDDTSMYGGAMRKAQADWKACGQKRDVLFASVYASPAGDHTQGPVPDVWAVDLPSPHFLEWCLFNCGYVNKTAFDFDGVMTVDQTKKPLYLPRKYPIPLIVTGRFERERERTEAWLSEYGIKFKKLVMYQGTPEQRDVIGEIAAHKILAWQKEPRIERFVESDPAQAELIAEVMHKPVICPTVAKVFT